MAHTPVLLNQVLEYLDPRPGEFIIDGTLDGGGHAREIIKKIMPRGTFLGVDWDKAMIARHKAERVDERAGEKNEHYVHGNYADLPEILKREKLGKADGLLLDLGFSSEQLEHSGRGFSFSEAHAGEPLFMTYDNAKTPVAELLRELKEEELADVIYNYGGERLSRRIAKAIKDRGRKEKIMMAGQLADAVRSAVPQSYERGRIDAATRTFQALRIYANGELENLKKLLSELGEIVRPGGRVAIISFHSLEDAIVKHAFQQLSQEKTFTILTKKPAEATREEINENPRSRSAKLRAVRRNEAIT